MLSVGDKVTYVTPFFVREKGILKSIVNHEYCFVVYNCDGDWENYENYTGACTRVGDLVEGWSDEENDWQNCNHLRRIEKNHYNPVLEKYEERVWVKRSCPHNVKEPSMWFLAGFVSSYVCRMCPDFEVKRMDSCKEL